MNTFYIDTSQVQQFTNKLRELHRSHFPIAIRQTLNDAAFDVLKTTLPDRFKNEFTIRNRSFLRSHSGVQKAEGWEINGMKSKVGITPNGSESAENLSKQEYGGSERRPFIYMDQARISKSKLKLVRRQNYFQGKRLIHGTPNRKRSIKSQQVADAYMAIKLGALVLKNSKSGQVLMQVDSISQHVKSRRITIKEHPIASYQRGRNINIKPLHFLQRASETSARKMPHFFIKNAKRRIEKALK